MNELIGKKSAMVIILLVQHIYLVNVKLKMYYTIMKKESAHWRW